MSEKNKKISKTAKIIIILLLIFVLLVVFTIGGFFAYLKLNGTGKKWGDLYFKYVRDLSKDLDEISSKQEEDENTVNFKNGLPYGVKKDVKAEFIDIDKDNTPEMITTYKCNDDSYGITVYYIKDNEVSYYPPQKGNDVVLLYNIEQKQYNYYWHQYIEDAKQNYYMPVENFKEYIPDSTVIFTDEEMESKSDVSEGEIPVLSKFDQTFIKIEDENKQFEITENMNEKEIKNKVKESVGEYKEIDQIITDEVKSNTENKVKEIENKKEQIKAAEEAKAAAEEAARKAEAMKITQSNVVEKLGEHLKYFSGCYLGSTYGIGSIYKLNEVTGKINVPGINSAYEMTYEVVGLNSINALNELFKKYMTDDVVSRLKTGENSDITKTLHDYNGKVYWGMGGIGDGPDINYKKAKLLSSEGDTSTIQLENINVLGDILTERITVTVKYDETTSSFKITDYSVKKMY